jgi:hypothetical protein
MSPKLEMLTTEDFAVSVGFELPPPALRLRLRSTPEAQAIVEALQSGELTEDAVREFVTALLGDLQKGKRFANDLALATLAVVLEPCATDFAEEYLRDLSRLRLAEMGLSSRIARECLKQRAALAPTNVPPLPAPH